MEAIRSLLHEAISTGEGEATYEQIISTNDSHGRIWIDVSRGSLSAYYEGTDGMFDIEDWRIVDSTMDRPDIYYTLSDFLYDDDIQILADYNKVGCVRKRHTKTDVY